MLGQSEYEGGHALFLVHCRKHMLYHRVPYIHYENTERLAMTSCEALGDE